MFEKITFRANTCLKQPIDIGLLFESMLFYGEVNVVADRLVLEQLITDIGIDILVDMMEEGLLDVLYTESIESIRFRECSGYIIYMPSISYIKGCSLENDLNHIVNKLFSNKIEIANIVDRMKKCIKVIHHDKLLEDCAKKCLLDQSFLKKAVTIVVDNLTNNRYDTKNIFFRTENYGDGIRIESNINLTMLNDIYKKTDQCKELNDYFNHKYEHKAHVSDILTPLFKIECDLYFAADLLSELVTDPLGSKLIIEKCRYLMIRSMRSRDDIESFQALIFNDSRALREAVNSKKVSINDIVKVIRKSADFKKWLRNQAPTSELVTEYYKAITIESPIDKLPVKTVRWAIFSGIGLVSDLFMTGGYGVAAGSIVGAFDTFVLDRLIRGWKPNQFINDSVKKVLDK